MALANYDLKNRTALITGAAGLLGLQHSNALIECGAEVVLTDIDIEKLEEAKKEILHKHPNSSVLAYEMDVSDEKSVLDVLHRCK